jgi:hypothetical protein
VYYLDGLPHAGSVYDLGRHGLFVATQQRLPELGSTVTLRFHLSGPFEAQWIRATCRVANQRALGMSGLHGFGLELVTIDEYGNSGVFAEYIGWLAEREATA